VGGLLLGAAATLSATTLFAASPTPVPTANGWLPALGTFVLGGLLGAIFGGSGFSAAFILTILAFIAMLVLRRFDARQPPIELPVVPVQFEAGLARPAAAAPPAEEGGESALLRTAKLNFVKLGLAQELGRPEHIRDLVTAEFFGRFRSQGGDRGGPGWTDIVTLNAELVKESTEGDRDLASVRLSGTLRAKAGTAPIEFEEVWSLSKPVGSASRWLLAGIQRTT
jgi:predicted lipid-binding transport protein (Tim44 family)